jgi:hypothetical protein
VTAENKRQRPDLTVKFLGVVWLGKMKVTPDAIVDKVPAYPAPTTIKTAQVLHVGCACGPSGVEWGL